MDVKIPLHQLLWNNTLLILVVDGPLLGLVVVHGPSHGKLSMSSDSNLLILHELLFVHSQTPFKHTYLSE